MTKTVESVINITGEELREQVIERLQTADESFLRLVHVMLQTQEAEALLSEPTEEEIIEENNPIIAHLIDGPPIREKEFFEDAAKGVEEVMNGGGIPAEEFFKKKEAWLESLK